MVAREIALFVTYCLITDHIPVVQCHQLSDHRSHIVDTMSLAAWSLITYCWYNVTSCLITDHILLIQCHWLPDHWLHIVDTMSPAAWLLITCWYNDISITTLIWHYNQDDFICTPLTCIKWKGIHMKERYIAKDLHGTYNSHLFFQSCHNCLAAQYVISTQPHWRQLS